MPYKDVPVLKLPRFRDAAEYLSNWLEENDPRAGPQHFEKQTPGFGYWISVQWIDYESLWTQYWDAKWFQDGIVAFTLIALEQQGFVKIRINDAGRMQLQFVGGEKKLSLTKFKEGELISELKHDPEFDDLNWDCVVSNMGRSLEKYYDNAKWPDPTKPS